MSYELQVVIIPEVCIQQFVQAVCHYLYNKKADQIHKTPPDPVEFSSPHHRLADLSHPEHLSTGLSKRSLLLWD